MFKRLLLLTLSLTALSAAPIVVVNHGPGSSPGVTGIDGIGLGWSMNFSAAVTIAAPLSNGNGPGYTASGNTAYITTGATPSIANAIASTSFVLPESYNGMFTLFPSLNLGPGTYWLLFTSVGPPSSYANIEAANPREVITAPGASFLGYYITTNNQSANNAFTWRLSVTTADTPEPATGLLLAPVVLLLVVRPLRNSFGVRRIG